MTRAQDADKYQPLLRKARKIADPFKRNLLFLGILTRALEEEGIKPVVVGGFALELYSTGGYATGDIDLVCSDSQLADKYLTGWGFQRKGRHWINPDLDLYIEIPGSRLSDNEEKRLSVVEIEGLKTYFIGIEDLVVDRLNAFVHWKSSDDGYWAKELLFLYYDSLDKAYLENRSREERTLSALRNLLREVERLKR